jgi:hypothetical protein
MICRFATNTLFALVFSSNAIAEGDSAHRVYDARKPVLPNYIVKPSPDGNYRVYDSKQVVVPKFIVKPSPDGTFKVYEAGKPVVSIKEVKP